ncbi:MAG: hypothetical protein JWN50_760 [Parcubacteria group bacterium]|nr:hypothetical protein [Parcubacteria group bacterium]
MSREDKNEVRSRISLIAENSASDQEVKVRVEIELGVKLLYVESHSSPDSFGIPGVRMQNGEFLHYLAEARDGDKFIET